jgi:hypothetical protein
MHVARFLRCMLVLEACGSSDMPAPTSSVAPTAPIADPDCDQATRPPALTRYDAIVDGAVFSLAVVQDAHGGWGPAVPLDMPRHHASTIAWEGLPLLDLYAGRTVIVHATGRGRSSLVHDPDRHTWFATYAARIDRVCP